MTRIAFILCFLFLVASPVVAKEKLHIDLATDHVDITTGFNGVDVILFGVKNGRGDLAVTISGPPKSMVVRKKNSVLGAWMNTEKVTFENVPGFYDYALSKDENDYTEGILIKNGIGLDSLKFVSKASNMSEDKQSLFLESLKRNKKNQNLFSDEAKKIDLLSDDFFRLSVYIPANVPVGDYVIKTYLINGNNVKEQKQTTLTVEQVGRNAYIYDFAINRSFYYGVLCVFMAVFAGWLINAIRGK